MNEMDAAQPSFPPSSRAVRAQEPQLQGSANGQAATYTESPADRNVPKGWFGDAHTGVPHGHGSAPGTTLRMPASAAFHSYNPVPPALQAQGYYSNAVRGSQTAGGLNITPPAAPQHPNVGPWFSPGAVASPPARMPVYATSAAQGPYPSFFRSSMGSSSAQPTLSPPASARSTDSAVPTVAAAAAADAEALRKQCAQQAALLEAYATHMASLEKGLYTATALTADAKAKQALADVQMELQRGPSHLLPYA